MGISLLFLQVSLFFTKLSAAHEALVVIGGEYPDGSDLTEVEVWSPTTECGINIKDTPIPFPDLQYGSSVAFLDDSLYVCGGYHIPHGLKSDNITMMNTCYVYSMADNEWSEGPTLKFFLTPQPSYQIQLWLATVGNSVVAVFKQSDPFAAYMSVLIDNEWSEPVPLNVGESKRIHAMVALDEKHFALLTVNTWPFDVPGRQYLYIFNAETASLVTGVMDYTHCQSGFLYNDQFSCPYKRQVWSLSFQENFTDPAWTVAYDLPEDIFYDGHYTADDTMAVVDNMLTAVWPWEGVVHYTDGDLWKTEALQIPRYWGAAVVVPCD